MKTEAPDKLSFAEKLMSIEHILMTLAESVPQIEMELCSKTKLKELCNNSKLSFRSYNCLYKEGFETLGQVVLETEKGIEKGCNLGMKGFREVKNLMEEAGLRFKEEGEGNEIN